METVDYSEYEPLSEECNYCHYPLEECTCCSECGFYPCICGFEDYEKEYDED